MPELRVAAAADAAVYDRDSDGDASWLLLRHIRFAYLLYDVVSCFQVYTI